MQATTPLHPILAALTAIEQALDETAAVDPIFLSTADKRCALRQASALSGRLEGLLLQVLAAADDVAEADGARDAGAWLAHATRRDPAEGRRLLRLARSLGSRPAVGPALRDGSVSPAQAAVIDHAVGELPDDLDEQVRRQAEEHLVEQAARFAPRDLKRLGRRVLQVVDPDAEDAHEQRLLEREDVDAARRTFLRTRPNGDGTTDLHLRVADLVAGRLLTYLQAFTSPRRPDDSAAADESGAGCPDDRRPYDQRLGHAFGAFLETVDPGRLPLHGGDATRVLVTIDLDTLRGDLGLGSGGGLVGDAPVSAGHVRRLACTSGIVPAVLGGASEVLDLGRTRRLFAPAQRKALALRQPTCRAEGCSIPAPWCEAHHAGDPWSQRGRTDLAEGRLLCSFHHHLAHDPRYDLTCLPSPERHLDGRVRFHRRE